MTVERAVLRAALATDRTIDIVTTGARSGLARTTEIWFTNIGGRIVICGTASGDGSAGAKVPRDWLANLRSHPAFLFRLKESIRAELPAEAIEVRDAGDRLAIMTSPETQWYRDHSESLEDLVRHSPIVDVRFTGPLGLAQPLRSGSTVEIRLDH